MQKLRSGAVHGLDVPHAFAVIANRTIRGEFSHARGVENRCACPRPRVVPERAHSLLGLDIALIIRKDEEWIVIEEILDDRAEQLDITAAEGAAGDEVDDFAQRCILLVIIARTIPIRLHLRDLGGGEPEEEKFSEPTSSRISTFAPSSVPMVSAPLSENFMLPVPLASFPAVEICSASRQRDR